MIKNLPKTLLIDIDGTLIEQHENYIDRIAEGIPSKLLPGTLDKLKEWESKSYKIILITARKESSRGITEAELARLGVFYDHLIMGVGVGPRIVINDLKPGHPDDQMAMGINLKRNTGIADITV